MTLETQDGSSDAAAVDSGQPYSPHNLSLAEIMECLQQSGTVSTRYDIRGDHYVVTTFVKEYRVNWHRQSRVSLNDNELVDNPALAPKEFSKPMPVSKDGEAWLQFLEKAAEEHLAQCTYITDHIQGKRRNKRRTLKLLVVGLVVVGIGTSVAWLFHTQILTWWGPCQEDYCKDESDTTEPGATEPDTTEPDTTEPDTTEPGATEKELLDIIRGESAESWDR